MAKGGVGGTHGRMVPKGVMAPPQPLLLLLPIAGMGR